MVELGAAHVWEMTRPRQIAGVAQVAELVGQDDRLLHLHAREHVDEHEKEVGEEQSADSPRPIPEYPTVHARSPCRLDGSIGWEAFSLPERSSSQSPLR
jgi:hypothetical protein